MEVVDTRKLQLEQERLLQQQEIEVREQKQQHHFHVLAVDDSVIDRKLLERLLRVRGSSCKVTCVDSGDKALKYLGLNSDDDHDHEINPSAVTSLESPSPPQPLHQDQGIKVNLIMTDYCMPGMSGYDLLKRVKLQGSSWKDVPVVVMSSENVPSRISMCLEGGAEKFLLKPLQLSDLEKLQPYFLKSHDNSSCDDQEYSSANSTTSTDSDSNADNLINNNSNNNNDTSISKRKAVSPEPPPERSRPKMKGLAMVV